MALLALSPENKTLFRAPVDGLQSVQLGVRHTILPRELEFLCTDVNCLIDKITGEPRGGLVNGVRVNSLNSPYTSPLTGINYSCTAPAYL